MAFQIENLADKKITADLYTTYGAEIEKVLYNKVQNPVKIEDEAEYIQIDELSEEENRAEVKKCGFSFPGFIGKIIDALDGDTKDGEIGNTKQGTTGDCYLLSAVNSLSYTEKGKEIIKNALDYQKNGSTVVHFAIGDFTVTKEELEAAKGKLKYSTGDDDMLIFELAMEKAIQAISSGKITNIPENIIDMFKDRDNGKLDGGVQYAILYIITGDRGAVAAYYDDINDVLDYCAENQNEDFVLCTSITDWEGTGKPVYVQDIYGNKVKFAQNHAYSIKSVDNKNGTVTIINPWDSSKEIVIDRKTFLKVFDGIDYLDMSEDNGYENWVKEQDKNREVINNIRYNYDYDYDKNGKIKAKRIQTRNGTAGLEYTYNADGTVTIKLFEVNKDGSITRKNWEVSEEEAENIIERGLLDYDTDNTSGAGLANDIFVSGIGKISDEKWELLRDWVLNMGNRIDVQTLAKFANLSNEDIDKAFYMIALNKKLPAEIVYLYLSGIWSEEEFIAYIKKHNIDYKTYEDVFGKK